MRLAFALPWSFLVTSGCGGLHVDDVSPNTVSPGATLTISGGGFADDARCTLVHGDVRVTLQLQEVQGANTLRGVVPLATPDASYAVEVEVNGVRARANATVSVQTRGLEMHFLDVGQGDATLIVAPTGETLLIDGGPRDQVNVVRAALAEHGGVPNIAVVTHSDADHLGGVVDAFRGDDGIAGTDDDIVPPTRIALVDDARCDSQLCDEARRLLGWPFAVANVGDHFALGEADVEIVAAEGNAMGTQVADVDTDNERSIAVAIRYAGRIVLVTGDLTGGGLGEANVEGPLAAALGRVDVLHVSHHGSATSSAIETLTRFAPRAAVLSVGTDSVYCHPADDVVAALTAVGTPLYITGNGIVQRDSCDSHTDWPSDAAVGLGTISASIAPDGTLVVAGDQR